MERQQVKRFIQREKGKKAEMIFERSCKELISEGKLLLLIREDLSGQDFILIFPNYRELKIEVKSSHSGEFFHNIRHTTEVVVVPLERVKISKKRLGKLVRMTKNRIMELDCVDSLCS